jgi:hypothetical protein
VDFQNNPTSALDFTSPKKNRTGQSPAFPTYPMGVVAATQTKDNRSNNDTI